MSRTPSALALAAARNPARLEAALVAERARRSGSRSFAAFVKQAWSQIDADPLTWNWHLEALSLHLEEVARGGIRRLVGNIGPRHGKSNVFAILWPAWVWTWRPAAKFIFLSYDDKLVVEHSIKCRAVIESDWYRELYRPAWTLAADQNTKHDFVNTAGGRRIASSIKSGVTGRGADYLAIDDPLSVEEASSAAARDTARRVISQAVGSRFNDPRKGCVVMMMQRVHAEDPSQWAITNGYEHFCVPTEFDPARRAVTYREVHVAANGAPAHRERVEFWRDPRVDAGELLFPQRFTPEVIASIRRELGSVQYTAQHLQRPVAHVKAGDYFKRSWFKFVDAAPADVVSVVRRWDLASTEGGGDWTIGAKVSRGRSGLFCVEDVVRVQLGPRGVRATVVATAEVDGRACSIVIPQDPGQAGKDQADEYTALLAGWIIRTVRETGDKEVRAGPASAQCEAENVLLVRAAWNEPFLQSLEAFPDSAVKDDDVDAFAGAITALTLGDVPRQSRYLAAMRKVGAGEFKVGGGQ